MVPERDKGTYTAICSESSPRVEDWQAVDLNALVEEALNLAYHGARAQDQSRPVLKVTTRA